MPNTEAKIKALRKEWLIKMGFVGFKQSEINKIMHFQNGKIVENAIFVGDEELDTEWSRLYKSRTSRAIFFDVPVSKKGKGSHSWILKKFDELLKDNHHLWSITLAPQHGVDNNYQFAWTNNVFTNAGYQREDVLPLLISAIRITNRIHICTCDQGKYLYHYQEEIAKYLKKKKMVLTQPIYLSGYSFEIGGNRDPCEENNGKKEKSEGYLLKFIEAGCPTLKEGNKKFPHVDIVTIPIDYHKVLQNM